jgi:hypothetical protein
MDACDKVTKLLQCGKDNSPEAVAGIMNNLENAITVRKTKLNVIFYFYFFKIPFITLFSDHIIHTNRP